MTVPGESMERQEEEDLSGKVAVVAGSGRGIASGRHPACENPLEYTGRVFSAERELAALGLSTDD
jgi:hypothetical protein